MSMMNTDASPLEQTGAPASAKPGRKRDPLRDAEILESALDVLAEVGYTRMTLAAVAERAKAGKSTFYRRWPSKEELVLDAVARMKRDQVDLDQLPDTGRLRSDLLGLFKPESTEEGERKLRVMAGLSSMLADHPRLAEAANSAIVEPWETAIRTLLKRARDRGDIAATVPLDTVARVIPEMAAYRSLSQRKPFDEAFLTALVDDVILPALSAP
jgi:AcrR family transcriptional regulator